MISIGNISDNISISLDILRERSLLYKNMLSDLNSVEVNSFISDNYSNMSLYLKFINTGEYNKNIDDILSLFKTCNYLEDIHTDYVSYKPVYYEKRTTDIEKSVKILHVLFRSQYTAQYYNVRNNFLDKYDGKNIYDNTITYDRKLYGDIVKYLLLNKHKKIHQLMFKWLSLNKLLFMIKLLPLVIINTYTLLTYMFVRINIFYNDSIICICTHAI